MLDLHYTKTIVLKVEVENRKSHRKTRAQPHQRTRFHVGFRLAVFAFLSTKLNVLGADRLMFS